MSKNTALVSCRVSLSRPHALPDYQFQYGIPRIGGQAVWQCVAQVWEARHPRTGEQATEAGKPTDHHETIRFLNDLIPETRLQHTHVRTALTRRGLEHAENL